METRPRSQPSASAASRRPAANSPKGVRLAVTSIPDAHVLAWERRVAETGEEVEGTASRDAVPREGGRGKKGGSGKTARDTGTSEPTVRRAKKLDKLDLEIVKAADKAGLSRAAKLRIARKGVCTRNGFFREAETHLCK